MVMPAAVKEAEAAADAAMAEMEKQLAETGDEPSSALEDAFLEGSQTESAGDGEVAQAQPVAAPDYEQKYKTLMGKYNAEVPRLQQQINEMNSRLSQMLTAPAPEAAPAVPEKDAHKQYLKPDEVSDYGEDVLELQSRMARGVAESVLKAQIQPLLNRVAYLESKLDSTKASSFWDKVGAHIPDAESINASDPLWHEFLSGVDPTSGLSYREIGEKAYQSGDVSRLVNLFKLYLGEPAVSATGTVSAPARKMGPPVKPARASGSSEPKAPKAPPVFRESEVKKFYDDLARGRFKGREAEAKAKERLIESAALERRIVAG